MLSVTNVFADTEKAVNLFIESQHKESDTGLLSDTEHGELLSTIPLQNEPGKVLVHWVYQVANYARNRVTLLGINGDAFTILSTIDVPGQVNAIRLEGAMLVVESLAYTKDDPRCCPSQKTTTNYLISGDRITQR
ncbi:MAG: hypothetical protein OEZ39_12005 [Gammaproteobacteria bacterium]|nr:hypothetical protein [Gammaproteobacteria bacterium]